jgi:hypothetical protein
MFNFLFGHRYSVFDVSVLLLLSKALAAEMYLTAGIGWIFWIILVLSVDEQLEKNKKDEN